MLSARKQPGVVRILTVADLHQRASLYEQLAAAVEEHRPDVVALVGDFLNVWQHGGAFLSIEECSRRVNALAAPKIICVRGNHEDANWLDLIPGRIQRLNGSAFCLAPLVIVGFPCLLGDETWFLEGDPDVSPDASEWFPKILRKYGPARTLWLMHEPPNLTRLSMRSGPLQGNPEWRDAIERYSPMVIVAGHDHQTPGRMGAWHDKIGETLCLNAGQRNEILHYFLIDASFEKTAISLPARLAITHWPTGETETIPND